jgi:hypothetical protein
VGIGSFALRTELARTVTVRFSRSDELDHTWHCSLASCLLHLQHGSTFDCRFELADNVAVNRSSKGFH